MNEDEYHFLGQRGGGGIQYHTDHHLMCLNLNLGKRHYIENNYEPQGGGICNEQEETIFARW